MTFYAAAGPRAGHNARFDPMQIAHHPLFTAKEKFDLLRQVRAEVSGDDRAFGFGRDQVDAAIEEVKRSAQSGRQATAMLAGGQ